MNLDDAQRKQVSAWIAAGAKLSEIQNKLAAEFGLRLTYIDVRFLVDDLKLTPQDAEPPKAPAESLAQSGVPASIPANVPPAPPVGDPLAPVGNLSVSVDQIARPGAVVSGTVTFPDAQKADWYIDQTGRLGLAPQQTGYRPAPETVQQFQMALEKELSKLGFA
jgi:hypothetical protein